MFLGGKRIPPSPLRYAELKFLNYVFVPVKKKITRLTEAADSARRGNAGQLQRERGEKRDIRQYSEGRFKYSH